MSAEQQQLPALPPATLDKYKSAGVIATIALKTVLDAAVEGAKIIDLCKLGDDKVLEELEKVYTNKTKDGKKFEKGIAHPTCVSVNNTIAYFTPTPANETTSVITLAKDDVAKIVVGVQIDGYASIAGETIIVGASSSSPATGIRADLAHAAHNVAQVALRLAKVGAKASDVSEGVAKFLEEYGGSVRGVESILSQQHTQNTLESKKSLVLFPDTDQKRDGKLMGSTIEEGDIYALDIILTSGSEAKAKNSSDFPTTMYTKTGSTYLLKMQTSRNTFSEISKKAGSFPFTLRVLDDEKKAKFGVQECTQHGLLREFPVLQAPSSSDLVSQTMVTFAVTKTGAIQLTPSLHTPESIKADHPVTKQEYVDLLAQPLKITKKKPAKKTN